MTLTIRDQIQGAYRRMASEARYRPQAPSDGLGNITVPALLVATSNGAQTAQTPLVDPRVAKHGGTRTDPKSNYDWPGMMDASSWARTPAHRHTRSYGCFSCGQQFKTPHAVYTHLAKVHDR